jgi:hypothetical protein
MFEEFEKATGIKVNFVRFSSGKALARVIAEVNGRDENKAFAYMKQLRPNVQRYTKSGRGGSPPEGLGQAGGGIFFIVDALDTKQKGYDVTVSFPKEGIGTAAEAIALIKGAKMFPIDAAYAGATHNRIVDRGFAEILSPRCGKHAAPGRGARGRRRGTPSRRPGPRARGRRVVAASRAVRALPARDAARPGVHRERPVDAAGDRGGAHRQASPA